MSLEKWFWDKYKIVLPKWLLKFCSKVYISKKPMFLQYNPTHHKVKGTEVREILNKLQDGDILLRRYDGYLNSMLTPGYWGHAAFYQGEGTVIHALGIGVVAEDILDFCRCDAVAVLRVKNKTPEMIDTAKRKAYEFLKNNTPYDYRFEKGTKSVYCTELVDLCYNGLFQHEYEEILGNELLEPVSIFNSEHVDKILVIKH